VRVATSSLGLLESLRGFPLAASGKSVGLRTGFAALDSLAPGKAFALGAMHECLSETGMPSFLLPILLARAVASPGRIVWCDPTRQFYPPGAAAMGLPLDRLLLVLPADEKDALWATAESLRCPGVGVCVTSVSNLTPLQARRLQLAAECGGGIGILLRPARAVSRPYAAATRWRVRPAVGERNLQRWRVELIHGHGGRVGGSVLLEVCRETNHVRAVTRVADRKNEKETAAIPA
jgi:protein ImuA